MTTKPLHLLLIEDVEDHALLIVRELSKEGFTPTFTRVETLAELKAALAEHVWDAIISDFRLPGFNAIDALHCVKASSQDVPFILVSGVIGEEMAAEVMKAGAHGYIMKGNYAILAPTLERELKEAAVRRERRETAANLARHRQNLEKLVQEKSAELEWLKDALDAEKRHRKQAEAENSIFRARLALCSSQLARINWEMKVIKTRCGHGPWRAGH